MTRVGEHDYQMEDLPDVRFVSLVGADGWAPDRADDVRLPATKALPTPKRDESELANSIAAACEKFTNIESADLVPLLKRIGDARVVLGTSADACAHHARTDRTQRVQVRRRRLAGRSTRRSLRAACRVSAIRVDRIRAFPVRMWRESHDYAMAV